jgi:Transposase IS66 family
MIELADLDLSSIADDRLREGLLRLLNLVEELSTTVRQQAEEIQRLRDENNRLKGEHGKPDIKPNTPPAKKDHSSEQERRQPKEHHRRSKLGTIPIDRDELCRLDPATLPPDAAFQGYREVVVQDLVLCTDNVRFRQEVYHAASTDQTYVAPLPAGYAGEFGPGIKALIIVWYFACQMSEPKIRELCGHAGVAISDGQVSNLLIKKQEQFHAESDAVYVAGLRSSPWQQIDDTATRVNGQNQHCHLVCNPLYTAYRTTEAKDRLSVIDVLRNGRPRLFVLNAEALGYLERLGLSQVMRVRLSHLPRDQVLDAAQLQALLDEHLPTLGPQQRTWIVEATLVAAYHAEVGWPVVRLLVCDDAPQFKWITDELALCWVHDGRHYKKLSPVLEPHRAALDTFLKDYWAFYHRLLAYRCAPTSDERARLERAFDSLFATTTGYWALDDRIAKTRAKQAELLQVLDHPEIPLHNNDAELGARMRVRKRDVSFGPRTREGAKAWDTFMTLAATTKKLGVSFYTYVQERICGEHSIPPLADLIRARAADLQLGESWDTTDYAACP